MLLTIEAIVILLTALVVTAMVFVHHARVLNGRMPIRRPLPPIEVVRAALARGAETGRALHVSPGVGTIGSGTGSRATTAETLAGLLTAERVSAEAALSGSPMVVSSGDAVTHLALRGTLRQVYRQAGQSQDYDPSRIELFAHQNEVAYTTGVATIYARQPLEASIIIGSAGQEFLLAGEEGARRGLPQVIGTTNPTGASLMILTSDHALIGEEIFAAEAYLTNDPAPQARLLTQDLLKTTVILLIVFGVVYALVQPMLGLPPLSL